MTSTLLTHKEPHSSKSGQKINWLRAAVLGANDGIVSIAGLVVGVVIDGALAIAITYSIGKISGISV